MRATAPSRRWVLGASGLAVVAGAVALLRPGAWPQGAGVGAGVDSDPPPGGSADADYALLQRQLQRNPRDARVWVLKARADMEAGRHALAAQAYAQALEVGPKVAKDAGVWVEYAEAQGLLQGGRLAGQPRALIERALALNPRHPQALDLAGSAAWEVQDFDAALQHWQRLQQQLTSDDPRQLALQAAIESARRRARLSLPAPAQTRQ